MELFSPPRVTADLKERGFPVSRSLDLRTGYDLSTDAGERTAWSILEADKPEVVVMSPECLPFSVARRPSWKRMHPDELRVAEEAGLRFMAFCMRVAEYQMAHGRGFLLEHPEGACSWELDSVREVMGRPGVISGVADLCQYGLAVQGGPPQQEVDTLPDE